MKNESKIYIKARKALRKIRALDLLITVLIVVALFSIPILLHRCIDIDGNDLGVYGDFFGSINTFVSALAFAGLIYTIMLQRTDLRLQREELQLTREELKRQATAQENSVSEQAAQMKLLEEQINKDIRPYINAYWEMRNGDIIFVVKNIGKTACSDFKIQCEMENIECVRDAYREDEFQRSAKELKERFNCFYAGIFPSSIEYTLPLISQFTSNRTITDFEFFSKLKRCKIILKCDFFFRFRGKNEHFSIKYDFETMELFENEEMLFHRELIEMLKKKSRL